MRVQIKNCNTGDIKFVELEEAVLMLGGGTSHWHDKIRQQLKDGKQFVGQIKVPFEFTPETKESDGEAGHSDSARCFATRTTGQSISGRPSR